jgi:glycosyltransferase involved in cell wall biosynthesis
LGIPVVFFSVLPVWSMGRTSGASSMARTVLAYKRAGCTVHLITPHAESGLGDEGIHVHQVSVFSSQLLRRWPRVAAFVGSNVEFPLRAIMTARRVRRAEERPGIIYGYEIPGALAARSAQKLMRWRWPLVTRFQGVIIHQQVRAGQWRKVITKPEHLLAYRIASDVCVMTNDGTRGDEVIRRLGDRPLNTMFLMNGVEPSENKTDLPAPPPLSLVTASRLVSWKRVDRAIMLVDELRRAGVDCTLAIIGDGEMRGEWELLSQRLGLTELVQFHGSIPNAQIGEHLRRAHCLVTLHDVSNLANPVFESLRAGLPVLSVADGSLDGVVVDGESGLLGTPGNEVESLATRLVEMVRTGTYPSLRQGAIVAGNGLSTWDQRMQVELDTVLELTSDNS